MKHSDEYSLKPLAKRHPLSEFRSRLLRHGAPISRLVHGDQISFQLPFGGGTLLATNYDYFEATDHWLYLLDQTGRPLDLVFLEAQVGFFCDIALQSDRELTMGQTGTHDRWRLTANPAGFWSFTPRNLFLRVNRFFLARRYLNLRHQPGPPFLYVEEAKKAPDPSP